MGCVQNSPETVVTTQRRTQIQRMKKQLAKKNKQINLLEKQNDELKKRKTQNTNSSKNSIKMNEIQIIEFQEDGKNQDAGDADNQLRQLLKCSLCEQQYNLKNRIPWMVCINQHTYCNDCISRMLQRSQTKCPQCRQQVSAGNRNKHISLLLQRTKNPNQKNLLNLNVSPIKQLNITVNKNYKFYNQFQYFPPNTQTNIVKGNQNAWYGLMFNQVIPVEGRFRFCFEVVFSIHNNIEIGLIDVNSKVQKGKMSNKRVTFHLYDGKVMDSGSIDVPVTAWRNLGQPVPKQQSCKVIVDINMDTNEIKWIVNDKVHAQTWITNYLKYAKAVPYLSLYHTDDVVNVNAW